MKRKWVIGVAKISRITGFTSFCYKLNRGKKRIIAYHNVIPDEYFDNSLHLAFSIKQSSFLQQVAVLSEQFEVDTDLDNPFTATLTFDDGYLNQYAVVHKIMREKKLTGYFFLAADLIMDQQTLSIDQLQYWFSYVPAGTYQVGFLEGTYSFKISENPDNRRKEFYKFVSHFNQYKFKHLKEVLDKTFPFESIKQVNNDYFRLRFESIPIDAVEEMKQDGQKIAAHSSMHEVLSKLHFTELEKDIKNCENLVGTLYNSNIFCYPFGSMKDVGDEVIKTVKRANFRRALSFGNAETLEIKSGNQEWFLPRMILPETADKDVIHFYLSGASYLLRRRKTLP